MAQHQDSTESPVDTAGFSERTRAYLFTNEQLDAILGSVDHAGKRVLAVTGSGDYSISAATRGAQVDSTDMTIYAERFARLKIAALHTLGRDEFVAFYSVPAQFARLSSDKGLPGTNTAPTQVEAFSPRAYKRIRKGLERDDRAFFDGIIGRNHFVANKNIPYALHFVHNRRAAGDLGHVPYLSSDRAYDDARYAQPGGFSTGDIADAQGAYDIIYVSNVPDCLALPESAAFLKRMRSKISPGGAIVGFGVTPGICEEKYGLGMRVTAADHKRAPSTMSRAYVLTD